MKSIKTIALLSGLVAAAGCASQGGGGEDGMMEDGATMFSAVLNPNGDMGHGGSAEARSSMSGTMVTITLDRGTTGGTHPWHIHEGRCGSGGGVVGQGSAYPVLEPDANGDATATANLTVSLDPSGEYYVQIHQSPSQMGTIAACGNLSVG